MTTTDYGSSIKVTVSEDEVCSFKKTWPCSGLPDDTEIWFEFSKSSGDLIDLHPWEIDGEAVLALSHDAQKFANLAL